MPRRIETVIANKDGYTKYQCVFVNEQFILKIEINNIAFTLFYFNNSLKLNM